MNFELSAQRAMSLSVQQPAANAEGEVAGDSAELLSLTCALV